MTGPPVRIGRCIYCGSSEDLSDEHVIPFSLSGTLELEDASCGACRDLTHPFEGRVAGYMLKAFRTRYKIRSRTKPPEEFKLARISRKNRELFVETLAADEHPAPVILRRFDTAGALAGLPPDWNTSAIFPERYWKYAPDLAEMATERGWIGSDVVANFDELAWGRTLAKIGYCYAVYEHGLGSFSPLPLDLICGRTENVSYTVGDSLDPQPALGVLHRVSLDIRTTAAGRFLVADLQLFANIGAPLYHVVVSRIQSDEHMRTLLENRTNS